MEQENQQTPPKEKEQPFEDYIVYRYRLREHLHLQEVLRHLHECGDIEGPREEHMQTMRLIIASHLWGFFDTRRDSLDVRKVWPKYFPQHLATIEKLALDLAPLLEKVRMLRHKAGAHSDLSLEAQNKARGELSGADTGAVLRRFFDVAYVLAKDEHRVPGLAEEIATWNLLPPGDDIPL
jgi:hypothetical protein